MDLRQMRGMELAETRTLRQKGGIWIVPSQSGSGFYRVHLMKKWASCTCPDYEKRREACKHIVAACVMQIKQEQNADAAVSFRQLADATENIYFNPRPKLQQ